MVCLCARLYVQFNRSFLTVLWLLCHQCIPILYSMTYTDRKCPKGGFAGATLLYWLYINFPVCLQFVKIPLISPEAKGPRQLTGQGVCRPSPSILSRHTAAAWRQIITKPFFKSMPKVGWGLGSAFQENCLKTLVAMACDHQITSLWTFTNLSFVILINLSAQNFDLEFCTDFLLTPVHLSILLLSQGGHTSRVVNS